MKHTKKRRIINWVFGTIILAAILGLILFRPFTLIIDPQAKYSGLVIRIIHVIILSAVFCIFRIWRGPTGADRIVAIDILGILIVGLCAMLTIATGRSWYIDIGIAWALQSFISTLALSKYLEGRGFDE